MAWPERREHLGSEPVAGGAWQACDDHAAAVARVGLALRVPGLDQAVHDSGDRPAGQAGVRGQLAGGCGAEAVQDVQQLALGAGQAQPLADGLVEHHHGGAEFAADELASRSGSVAMCPSMVLSYIERILSRKLNWSLGDR